ncbi:MAG TPA: AAA family ATPase [Candidatus Eisenbacteria bacterium]
MRREAASTYSDQFEYLAERFELIRLQADAYALRSEAGDFERTSRWGDRHGKNHLLGSIDDLDRTIQRREEAIRRRHRESESHGPRFPIDLFVETHQLTREEYDILLVLLFNESAGRGQGRITSGNDILNLLFTSHVEALRASRYLSASSTLLNHGLVRALPEEEGCNFLRSSYEVTEKTLREVLGVRARPVSGESAQAMTEVLPDGPFRLLQPRFSLERVVLESNIRQQLEDVLWQVRDGHVLFEDWELGRLLEKGRGVVILLSGLPGTGKTMSAEALAGSLERQLLIADYSQLESKWIGETEKNIVTVFRAARDSGAVLLLDEADAILAGRLEGGHYNDRAYNRQVSLLLQELEQFEGLCILTTNRETSLDDGLARRLGASISFGVPGASERERIWKSLVSARVPLAADVDFTRLAIDFALCGGNIKNAVVSALRSAARRGAGTEVGQSDFIRAAESEKSVFLKATRPIGFKPRERYTYS